MIVLAYYFDKRLDWLPILRRTRDDPRFGGRQWHASAVSGCNLGSGRGTLIRTDPRATFYLDESKTPLWDWTQTDEPGLYAGIMREEFADRFAVVDPAGVGG